MPLLVLLIGLLLFGVMSCDDDIEKEKPYYNIICLDGKKYYKARNGSLCPKYGDDDKIESCDKVKTVSVGVRIMDLNKKKE